MKLIKRLYNWYRNCDYFPPMYGRLLLLQIILAIALSQVFAYIGYSYMHH